jgi:hypothetical protein
MEFTFLVNGNFPLYFLLYCSVPGFGVKSKPYTIERNRKRERENRHLSLVV